MVRTRDPEAKRAMLLEAATAAFAAEGFKLASTVAIASAAGVSEGLIFHYFGSKLGLLEACVARRASEVVDRAMDRSGLDFDALLVDVFAWVGADEMSARLSQAGDDRVMGAVRRGWQRAVVPSLAEALAAEQHAARCRPGDPLVIAQLQFAVVGEAMLMFFAAESTWSGDVDAVVRETAQMLRSMIV